MFAVHLQQIKAFRKRGAHSDTPVTLALEYLDPECIKYPELKQALRGQGEILREWIGVSLRGVLKNSRFRYSGVTCTV